jgi:cytoskeletal protein CcmA (bactofilin family)
MFKDSSNNKKNEGEFREVETIIGQSVRVEGEFKSDGSVVVEGIVVGSLKTSHNLKIGDQAQIKANIEAGSAWVAGVVEGNIKIKDDLELTPSAKITGDIETDILVVGKGATINGHLKMGGDEKNTKKEDEHENK